MIQTQSEFFRDSDDPEIDPPPSSELLMKDHMYCGTTEPPKLRPVPLNFFTPPLISGEEPSQRSTQTPNTAPRPRRHVCVCACACADFRLQVVLLYHGQRVMQVTTKTPEGCFICQGQVPLGNEHIYGSCSAQQVCFPSPASVRLPSQMAEAMGRLLCHLERGVLLWLAQEGLFIKRFCQGRVYWSGPQAKHTDRPNKLEREKTFKLFDIPTFYNGKASQTPH